MVAAGEIRMGCRCKRRICWGMQGYATETRMMMLMMMAAERALLGFDRGVRYEGESWGKRSEFSGGFRLSGNILS
jgi:hypothetical protein